MCASFSISTILTTHKEALERTNFNKYLIITLIFECLLTRGTIREKPEICETQGPESKSKGDQQRSHCGVVGEVERGMEALGVGGRATGETEIRGKRVAWPAGKECQTAVYGSELSF